MSAPSGATLPALFLAFGLWSLSATSAQALGVGRPQTLSALGQPLHLLFPVALSSGETLGPDCVRAEVLAGDARLPAHVVQIVLDGESEASVRALRLQSALQIDEPLVTVNLSLGCPARLMRQYTAFIDPPGANLAAAAQTAAPVATVRNYTPQMQAALSTAEARPASLLAQPPQAWRAADAASAAASRVASSHRREPEREAAREGAREQPVQAPVPPKPQRKPASKPAASALATLAGTGARGGARLQMEPAEALLGAPTASAPAAAAASQPASAASAPPDLQAERMAGLEASLKKLQDEQRATLAQMQGLRLQLERAQGERYGGPLVYVLGLLCIALGAAAFYFRRSREQERQLNESAWWSDVKHSMRESAADEVRAPAPRAVVPPPAPRISSAEEMEEHTIVLPGLSVDAGPHAMPEPETVPVAVSSAPAAHPEPDHEPVSFTLVEPAADSPAPAPAAAQPTGRINVEDLIDLEQQVEFFLVLGQDDAALELLNKRIDGDASEVPWPYLKALSLHQRAGRLAEFEALARRYAEHLGQMQPEWAQNLEGEGGLADQPEMLKQVQRRWSSSASCMALLQALLVGHAETRRPPEPLARGALDLAVLADLLTLYGVARDLSEHEVRSEDIDLFLPLDAPAHGSAAGMMATMIWQATPASAPLTAAHALEVDISLDGDEAAPTQPDTKA